MASRQAVKEERAEAAAREAADELHDVNKARREHEIGGIIHDETQYHQGNEQRSTGVIGSIFQSVKETITGKAHDTAETTRESKDVAAQKMHDASETAAQNAREAGEKVGEYKDYTENKTKEMADSAAEKATHAKDAAVGKASEYKNYATEKAKETKDSTMEKAGKYKDYAAEKAKEAKDATMAKASEYKDYGAEKAGEYKDSIADKAKETKDATMEKAVEYKDYTAEKATEGKDTTIGKISGLKDTAADAARRAVGFLIGRKEETTDAAQRKEEPKELYEETEENARKTMQELKLKEEGIKDEPRQRAEADRETAAARGSAAKKHIYGAMGNVTESIKEKLTMPSDIVKETRAARELGGPKRGNRTDVDEDSHVAPSGYVFTTAKDDRSS